MAEDWKISTYKQRIAGSNAHYAKLPISSFLNAQREQGITKLDFVIQAPHLWCDQSVRESTEHIENQLSEAGLTTVVVTPKPYKYAICAESSSAQGEATRGYYINCLDVARSLGATYMIITAEGACWDVKRDILLKQTKETLRDLAEQAEGRGITLLLTSVFGDESPLRAQAPILNRLTEIAEMLETVNSPALKAMLDLNVACTMGETITQWFAALKSDVRAVRFTDGNYNGYRAWGEGCYPCDRFLRELDAVGYDGILSLYMAGERYFDAPCEADRKNVAAILSCLAKEGE